METSNLRPQAVSPSGALSFVALSERPFPAAARPAIPPRRPGIVDRPALINALVSVSCAPVVLVSAPAGYGKTTLLELWRERDQRPFAWLSLEPVHDQPLVLTRSLLQVLGPIVRFDNRLAAASSTSNPPVVETVLQVLMDECVARGESFVLVLDDLHFLTDRRCMELIGHLLKHLPRGCHCALATRTDPALQLACLRAHGRLTELRAAELALGREEAHALLTAAGAPLKEDLVARLVERTEGWPAALYLAALSLRNRADPATFIDRFTGTSRHVADFLSEDVLAQQPPAVTDFLLRTCVLDELTDPLCAALSHTGHDASLLRHLECSNLFIIPLDEERTSYRYHHLFAQYLRAELARRSPALVSELHRRAWHWYRAHDQIDRALEHAHASGDTAADMVCSEWFPLVEQGRLETLSRWVEAFDETDVAGHAPLAIVAAWVAALGGDRVRAARCAAFAHAGQWDGAMPDGSASLESALAIMDSAFGLDDLSGMSKAAARAVQLEPAHSSWHGFALLLLGITQKLQGDLEGARRSLKAAVQLSGHETTTVALAFAYLALIYFRAGDEAEALDYARRAQAVVESNDLRDSVPSIATYSVLPHLLSRRGDLDGATHACERVSDLLPRSDAYWWQSLETRLLTAPALLAIGRADDAATQLRASEALLALHADAGTMAIRFRETSRALHLTSERRARPPEALSDAERRILRLLSSDLTLREIGRELLVSLNTVRTHKRSIYRKLGVSSRKAAVVAARITHAAHHDSPG